MVATAVMVGPVSFRSVRYGWWSPGILRRPLVPVRGGYWTVALHVLGSGCQFYVSAADRATLQLSWIEGRFGTNIRALRATFLGNRPARPIPSRSTGVAVRWSARKMRVSLRRWRTPLEAGAPVRAKIPGAVGRCGADADVLEGAQRVAASEDAKGKVIERALPSGLAHAFGLLSEGPWVGSASRPYTPSFSTYTRSHRNGTIGRGALDHCVVARRLDRRPPPGSGRAGASGRDS